MYYRRVSILILYNSKKEILLQHRTKDAPHYPDYWGFFGGDINENETPVDALKREAMEELGLEIQNALLFKRYEIQEDIGLYERFVFLVPTTLSVKKLRSQQKEGAGLNFYRINKINELKFNKYNMVILRDIEKYLDTGNAFFP